VVGSSTRIRKSQREDRASKSGAFVLSVLDYFEEVKRAIDNSKTVVESNIEYKEFSEEEGMIRGRVLFINGYILELMEYICIGREKPKYRFHLKNKDDKMIFRYDNAPHHDISTFPHHKHVPGRIKPSKEVGLIDVLKEIEAMLSST
jgi:hypothetical protein